jgi:hypothetical protein
MTQKQKKSDAAKKDDDKLEEALEDSFPASDPPSMTQPKPHAEKAKTPPSPDDDDDLTRVDLYEDEDK